MSQPIVLEPFAQITLSGSELYQLYLALRHSSETKAHTSRERLEVLITDGTVTPIKERTTMPAYKRYNEYATEVLAELGEFFENSPTATLDFLFPRWMQQSSLRALGGAARRSEEMQSLVWPERGLGTVDPKVCRALQKRLKGAPLIEGKLPIELLSSRARALRSDPTDASEALSVLGE